MDVTATLQGAGGGGVMQALPWGPGWELGGMRLSRGAGVSGTPPPPEAFTAHAHQI